MRRFGLHRGNVVKLLQLVLPVGRRVEELSFDDVGSGDARLQGLRRIQCDQLAVIDDGDAIAQTIGLVHIVGGDEDGEVAIVLEFLGEHLPNGDTGEQDRGRWWARRGKDFGAVDEAACDFEMPLHAAGKGFGLRVPPLL